MNLKNSKSQKVFTDAIQFAAECHSGAFRKGTDIPYIVHPMEVAAIVSTMTTDPNVLAAAVLHDVVEDAGTELETIREKFNDAVADLPPEETWKIRKLEAIKGLEQAGIEAKMIALGDKLSNARAIYRDYRELGDGVWQRFNKRIHLSKSGIIVVLPKCSSPCMILMLTKNINDLSKTFLSSRPNLMGGF